MGGTEDKRACASAAREEAEQLLVFSGLAGKRDIVIGRAYYRDNARGRMLGDDQGLLKAVFDRRTRALLGVSVVGEDATELVHFGQLAIQSGHGMQHLVEMCLNYPTLTELYKAAAFDAMAALAAPAARSAA